MVLCNKINFLLAKIELFFLPKKVKRSLSLHGFQYGDKHSRNVLFDGKGLYVTDFENTCYDEFFEFDIFYCLLGLCQLIKGLCTRELDLCAYNRAKFGSGDAFDEIVSFYQWAVKINPWYGGDDNLLQKIHFVLKVLFK